MRAGRTQTAGPLPDSCLRLFVCLADFFIFNIDMLILEDLFVFIRIPLIELLKLYLYYYWKS